MRLLPHTALAALIAISASPAVRAEALDVTRNNVMTFMSEMHREHGFDPTALATLLRDAQTQPRIVEAMERPAERSMAWWEYRARFMTDERIDGGVKVWQEHRETLEKVARDSGVPPQYLIAITGVETLYGRITGNYRILDSLATLAFDYPRRATFFRGELTQFLLLAREEGLDPAYLEGLLRRRFGHRAVHAVELPPLRHRRQRRRQARPVELGAGCVRQHRALFPGEWLAHWRAGVVRRRQ